MENDLYTILELNSSASDIDIKTNFKKLALKYHPDKNKNANAKEKFNQIRVAYDILSDSDKKKQYDSMVNYKKNKYIEILFMFIKEITNPKTIHNLIEKQNIKQALKEGNISNIAQKMIDEIIDNIDVDIDVNHIDNLFMNKNTEDNSDYLCSESYEQSNYDTLDILGNIKVSLDEIYNNTLKEITIKRTITNGNDKSYDINKYTIPLYDNHVTLIGAGDKIISSNTDNSKSGDVILRIYHKKDPNNIIIKEGHNIIYNIDITLYELFYGFKKKINYFGSNLNLCSNNPLKEYKFDGNSMSMCIKNFGLPCNQNGDRGNLYIFFQLKKDHNFSTILKQYLN